MTHTWITPPEVEVELTGKVAGNIMLTFQGDGRVYARDHRQVTFRDRPYSVSAHFKVDHYGAQKGEIEPTEHTRVTRPNVLSLDNLAPPTHHKAIVDAIITTIHDTWTPELERRGLEVDVNNNLCRLERDEIEALEALNKVYDEINAQKKRLDV